MKLPVSRRCMFNLGLTAIHHGSPDLCLPQLRSDFIGDCASFAGLTQMINDSNYLVPQMTREQKRMAIEGCDSARRRSSEKGHRE